jgi:hypothetical protein
MTDIRIAPPEDDDFDEAAAELELSKAKCYVPEPYCRAQRPDQRVRTPIRHEPTWRLLERNGLWFQDYSDVPVYPTIDDAVEEESIEALRATCEALNLPVTLSDDRTQLLVKSNRILEWRRKGQRRGIGKHSVVRKELKTAYASMGLEFAGPETAEQMAETLEIAERKRLFNQLTLQELRAECEARGLYASGVEDRQRLIAMILSGSGSDSPRAIQVTEYSYEDEGGSPEPPS